MKDIQTNHQNFIEFSKIVNNEVVISNIWAYFIDSKANHGMKSIVLEAILTSISKKTINYRIDDVIVIRELHTDNSERSDIVVIGEEFILILENKINHKIGGNNLKAYKESAVNIYKSKYGENLQPRVFVGYLTKTIVLNSVIDKKENSYGDFYITYDEVFNEIKKNDNFEKNNNFYFQQFLEAESVRGNMIKNIENSQKYLMDINNSINNDTILKLEEALLKHKQSIKNIINQLSMEIVNQLNESTGLKNCFVLDNSYEDNKQSIITWAYFSGGINSHSSSSENHSFKLFYSFGKFEKSSEVIYLKLTDPVNSSSAYISNDVPQGIDLDGLEYKLVSVDQLDKKLDEVIANAVRLIIGKTSQRIVNS